MPFDPATLVDDIQAALRAQVAQGWTAVRSLTVKQSKLLATQADFITQSRLNGSLRHDDALFSFFVEQLKDMTANFLRTVSAMTNVTLEKAWNAVVRVVWGAINETLGGAGLPRLPIPRPPRA